MLNSLEEALKSEDIDSALQIVAHTVDSDIPLLHAGSARYLAAGLTQLGDSKCINYLLRIIGTLGRKEENRPVLTDERLMQLLLSNLASDEKDRSSLACRAIGNICADNDEARMLFLNQGGVPLVMRQARGLSEMEDCAKFILPLCACVTNLVVDCEALQLEFVSQNAMPSLVRIAQNFCKTNGDIAKMCINGISLLAETAMGEERLISDRVIDGLLDILRGSAMSDVVEAVLEFFVEFSEKEPGRLILCKSPMPSVLLEMIGNHVAAETEDSDGRYKKMTDLVVLLTSGDESFDELVKFCPGLLKELSLWLRSANRHMQVSAGLAIGNYTRSDDSCNDVLHKGIHENLINLMTENLENEDFGDRMQAFASALRNLCVPVKTRPVLARVGLHELAAKLVQGSALPVQFKALAILRLLAIGQAVVAARLCADGGLMATVCELASKADVSGVSSESQRLLAALVKNSDCKESMVRLADAGCTPALVALVRSDFQVMKNEGLIAIVMLLTSADGFLGKLVEAEFFPALSPLLTDSSSDAQTLCNALATIMATLSLDGGRPALENIQVEDLVTTLTGHSQALVCRKAEETLSLIRS